MSTGSSSLAPLLVAARGLRSLDHPSRTASDLADDLVGFDHLFCLLEAERARAVAAFDAIGGGGIDGFQSTASWLRARTTIAPGASTELVRVARALDRQLPATAAALRDGAIGWTATTAVVHGLAKLIDPAHIAQADLVIAVQAPSLSPQEITYATRRIVELLHPESLQRDANQRYLDREFTLSPMLDGAVALRGQLDAELGAELFAGLMPLMKPADAGDDRTPKQRRADALLDLVRAGVAAGAAGLETASGLPPTLLVRVDLETLARATTPDALPAIAGAASALATETESIPASASTLQSGWAPADLDRTFAEADWGGPLTDHALRRIGCTAQLIRLVTNGKSRILDVGTAARLAGPAQRIALAHRDRGCVFPGCDRIAPWTDAHHIYGWTEDDGPTDLDNLVEVCRHHHRLCHEGGWQIRRTTQGIDFHDNRGTYRASYPIPTYDGARTP
jgi:hypothetical protein